MGAAPGGEPEPTVEGLSNRLFGPGPKRILGLDGGGIRGAITIAFLEKIEDLLSARYGRRVLLCEYFDLIGGTSTGSIIAAGLALGFSAAEMRAFYLSLSPKIFQRSRWRVLGVQAKFDARFLRQELSQLIGARTLDSADLKTGLAIVMKRIDTGSPWIVSNNPRSAYWDTPADGSHIGNRCFPLANLIRASAAAPYYFDPELLPIVAGAPPGLFLDGAVTPFNNPSLALFLLATLDCHGLKWPARADKLSIVSVGTGRYRTALSPSAWRRLPATALAMQALSGLIADTQTLSLTLMHALSGSASAWPINSELGSLTGQAALGGARLFEFHRYDVELEAAWLSAYLDLKIGLLELMQIRRLDDPTTAHRAYEIGKRAAEIFVTAEDFSPDFDL